MVDISRRYEGDFMCMDENGHLCACSTLQWGEYLELERSYERVWDMDECPECYLYGYKVEGLAPYLKYTDHIDIRTDYDEGIAVVSYGEAFEIVAGVMTDATAHDLTSEGLADLAQTILRYARITGKEFSEFINEQLNDFCQQAAA